MKTATALLSLFVSVLLYATAAGTLMLVCYGAYYLLGDQNITYNDDKQPSLSGLQWTVMLIGYFCTCVSLFLGLAYLYKNRNRL